MSSEELDQQAEDVYNDRRITRSVYCGRCGYNLRTLPHCYTCPECGSGFNARPLSMTGIFMPHEAHIPFLDTAAAIACALSAVVFGFIASGTRDGLRIGLAAVFLILAVMFASRAYARFLRFVRAVDISRRIAAERSAEEE